MSFAVAFREDSSCHIVGRLTMADGTGAATGIAGEGNFVKVADLTSITRNIYDETNANTLVLGPTTLTLADVVLDTVVTSTAIWEGDAVGYNFKDRLLTTAFPIGGHLYRVEYAFVPTAGATHGWTESVIGPAESFVGS